MYQGRVKFHKNVKCDEDLEEASKEDHLWFRQHWGGLGGVERPPVAKLGVLALEAKYIRAI